MERLLDTDGDITAVVIWSPTTAVGALSAARSRRYRIPEDLSAVCIHDSPVASYWDPPLTVVGLPLAEMAEQAVDALVRIVDGHEMSSAVVRAAPILIERGSTAPPQSGAA